MWKLRVLKLWHNPTSGRKLCFPLKSRVLLRNISLSLSCSVSIITGKRGGEDSSCEQATGKVNNGLNLLLLLEVSLETVWAKDDSIGCPWRKKLRFVRWLHANQVKGTWCVCLKDYNQLCCVRLCTLRSLENLICLNLLCFAV